MPEAPGAVAREANMGRIIALPVLDGVDHLEESLYPAEARSAASMGGASRARTATAMSISQPVKIK